MKKKRLRKKTGLPPGTPVYTGKSKSDTRISFVKYDENNFEEFNNLKLSDLDSKLVAESVNWIRVSGLHNQESIQQIGEKFKVNPLTLEDILNVENQAKIEESENSFFINLKHLKWDNLNRSILSEQISVVLSKNVIITFEEEDSKLFNPIIERLKAGRGKARLRQEDYLAYQLMDFVVDNYYIMLDEAEEQIEAFEELLIQDSSQSLSKEFLALKKNLAQLRRSINPLLDNLRFVLHEESEIITEVTRQHLQDVYDHLAQIINSIDNMREMAATLLDLFIASSSNRMNQIMKRLTVMAAIFIPITYLTGVYGMNFKFMPELEWKLGYPIFILFSVLTGVGTYYFMKWKKWF